MNTHTLLEQKKRHLAGLIEALQRCVYFLDAAGSTLSWPLDKSLLEQRKKDPNLFGALAAINERFAKLQDTLGAAMRHALLLLGEPSDTFLKVLSYYEKVGVIGSIDEWQISRSARNISAHAYETDYAAIAEHFNTLHELQESLYRAAARFVAHCLKELNVQPASGDFAAEFGAITQHIDNT
jgi:hypothetical protein